MWVRIPPGAAHFFFEKKREWAVLVGVVLLPCLVDICMSQLHVFNHVHMHAVLGEGSSALSKTTTGVCTSAGRRPGGGGCVYSPTVTLSFTPNQFYAFATCTCTCSIHTTLRTVHHSWLWLVVDLDDLWPLPQEECEDPWEWWNRLRTLCFNHSKLGLGQCSGKYINGHNLIEVIIKTNFLFLALFFNARIWRWKSLIRSLRKCTLKSYQILDVFFY